MKKSNQQTMQHDNRLLVLNTIKENEPISRAYLAKKLHMSATSMTRICIDLLERHLILEEETPSNNGKVGRNATMMKINPEAFYSLGILLRTDFIDCCVIDYKNEVVEHHKFKMKVKHTSKEIKAQIETCITQLKTQNIQSIGLSIPGTVDTKKQIVKQSSLFDEKDVTFSLANIVESDVYASIIEEKQYIESKNVALLSLSQDINVACILDNHLLRGAHYQSGKLNVDSQTTISDIVAQMIRFYDIDTLILAGRTVEKRADLVSQLQAEFTSINVLISHSLGMEAVKGAAILAKEQYENQIL